MKANINVPTELNEITLKQYQKFLKVQDSKQNNTFLQTKMIEIFCNVKMQDALNIKLSDADRIASLISKMFEQKPDLVKSFWLNNVEYGFVPDLDEITLGEYIDLDTYMSEWENIQIAMNVLYRPIKQKLGEKYLIEEYDPDTKDKLINMPMDAVFGSIIFFYRLGIELSQTMMNYLENEEGNLQVQGLDFLKNGDGIQAFTDSLEEILQDLKISPN
jgi:hypothetical protein|tara:strand:- start:121 stop:771 length:651 start_codon:yes stop_codon:yes gene_type:complete